MQGDNPLDNIEKLPDFSKKLEKPAIKVKINFKANRPEDVVSDSDSEGLPPVMNTEESSEVLGFFLSSLFSRLSLSS